MGFSFGSYEEICKSVALVVCPLLGEDGAGIEASCYARNVELNRTIIFQPATCFVHIAALVMVLIMVLHIRSKYTAIGRKEIILFFYLYAAQELLSIFLDSAIIPTNSVAYPWFAAANTGLISATCWCLLVSGFVGFQIVEDGTTLSLWFLRISSFVIWLIAAFLAMATFKNLSGFNPKSGVALWASQYIFNALCLIIYVVLQLILVVRTLDDRWAIGDIIFGCAAFAVGQALLYGFNTTVCNAVKHYLDALFFSTLCSLFAVMMVYKYWDSITKEDLEFSVGSKQAVWDITAKDGMNDNMSTYGQYAGHGSMYSYPPQKGGYNDY